MPQAFFQGKLDERIIQTLLGGDFQTGAPPRGKSFFSKRFSGAPVT